MRLKSSSGGGAPDSLISILEGDGSVASGSYALEVVVASVKVLQSPFQEARDPPLALFTFQPRGWMTCQ